MTKRKKNVENWLWQFWDKKMELKWLKLNKVKRNISEEEYKWTANSISKQGTWREIIFALKGRNGMEYLSCIYLRSRHHGSHVAAECVNSPHYSHRQILTPFCPKIIYYRLQDTAEVAGWCVEKKQVTHVAYSYTASNAPENIAAAP